MGCHNLGLVVCHLLPVHVLVGGRLGIFFPGYRAKGIFYTCGVDEGNRRNDQKRKRDPFDDEGDDATIAVIAAQRSGA